MDAIVYQLATFFREFRRNQWRAAVAGRERSPKCPRLARGIVTLAATPAARPAVSRMPTACPWDRYAPCWLLAIPSTEREPPTDKPWASGPGPRPRRRSEQREPPTDKPWASGLGPRPRRRSEQREPPTGKPWASARRLHGGPPGVTRNGAPRWGPTARPSRRDISRTALRSSRRRRRPRRSTAARARWAIAE